MLKLLAKALGVDGPRPEHATVREDADNVGYFLMAGGSGVRPQSIPPRFQREWRAWVESL